jgi:uncharacterized repeat protein (TIGR01451 family)
MKFPHFLSGSLAVSFPILFALVLVLMLSALGSVQAVADLSDPQKAVLVTAKQDRNIWDEKFGKFPLLFEQNIGQAPPEVKFISRVPGFTLFLMGKEALLTFRNYSPETGEEENFAASIERNLRKAGSSSVIRMKPMGANSEPRVVGIDLLPGKTHYLKGKKPIDWHTDVPNFSRVMYRGIYDGIDLVFYGNPNRLEYDYIVHPGADPVSIRLSMEGTDRILIDNNGDLLLSTPGGELKLRKPTIHQEINGETVLVSGGYVLLNSKSWETKDGSNQVGFQIGAYDQSRLLVIDPILEFSTYIGGFNADEIEDVQVDGNGFVYLTGTTGSLSFPTTAGAADTTFNGSSDVFVMKADPSTLSLVYSSFLGGTWEDTGSGIAVDGSGNAWVTGQTNSVDFPVLNGFNDTHSAGTDINDPRNSDVFVTQLTPSGSLNTSSFFGTQFNDFGEGITLGSSGEVYVTGHNGQDVFVAKVSSDGSNLDWQHFWGGSTVDQARDIAVDAIGRAHVVGETFSDDFPITGGAISGSYNGGFTDGFLSVVNNTGSGLDYSTYLGGGSRDSVNGIDLDSSDNAFVTGLGSPGFPTTPAVFDTVATTSEGFVAKISPSGSGFNDLIYSTFIGLATPYDIAVGPDQNANITGITFDSNFLIPAPNINDPVDTVLVENRDAFHVKMNFDGSQRIYATYLGGEVEILSPTDHLEDGNAIAVGSSCEVYIGGRTGTIDFPISSPTFDNTLSGNSDAFLALITGIGCQFPQSPPILEVTKSGSAGTVIKGDDFNYTIHVTNNGPGVATSLTATDTLPDGMTYIGSSPADACTVDSIVAGVTTVTCSLGGPLGVGNFTAVLLSVTAPGISGSITNTVTVDAKEISAPVATTEETQVVDVAADLEIFLFSHHPEPASAGSPLFYSANVINNGPSDAQAVTVTVSLPVGAALNSVEARDAVGSTIPGVCAWTGIEVACDMGTVNSGDTVQVFVDIQLPDRAGIIVNIAEVTSVVTDPEPSNNSATDQVTVKVDGVDITDSINLPVDFLLDFGMVDVGTSVAGTVSVTNNRSGQVSVTLNPTLAQPFSITTNTCAGGDLPPNASCEVGILFEPTQPDVGGTLSDAFELDVGGIAVPFAVTGEAVESQADLNITFFARPSVSPAGITQYNIGITNEGPNDAEGFYLNLDLPPTVSLPRIWPGDPIGDLLVCTNTIFGTGQQLFHCELPPGEIFPEGMTANIDVEVNRSQVTLGPATATVGAGTPDPDESNNTREIDVPDNSPLPIDPGGGGVCFHTGIDQRNGKGNWPNGGLLIGLMSMLLWGWSRARRRTVRSRR